MLDKECNEFQINSFQPTRFGEKNNVRQTDEGIAYLADGNIICNTAKYRTVKLN